MSSHTAADAAAPLATGKIVHRFTRAVLFEIKLTEAAAKLSASLQIAWIVEMALKSYADLIGADLSYANLSGANLSYVDLSGADLSYANLSGANLSGAKLAGANLIGANLSYVDLSGADLSGAKLIDAKLSGAKLAVAKLAGADLIDGGQRSDGYRFIGWIKGGLLMIRAGCRNFSIAEYREHNKHRDGTPLGAETSAILDHIEAVARIRNMTGAPE